MGNLNSCMKNHNYSYLDVEKRKIKLLDKPNGFVSGMMKDHLGYQMQFSVEKLENDMASEGVFHVLQLKLSGLDKLNPHTWTLYADGEEVACGSGDFARALFCEDECAFLNLCRDAINDYELPTWTKHDYKILCSARKIKFIKNRYLNALRRSFPIYKSL